MAIYARPQRVDVSAFGIKTVQIKMHLTYKLYFQVKLTGMKSPAASTSVTKQTTGTLQRVDLKGKFLFSFIFCFILVRYHEISN